VIGNWFLPLQERAHKRGPQIYLEQGGRGYDGHFELTALLDGFEVGMQKERFSTEVASSAKKK
jgi:hypothetical protein